MSVCPSILASGARAAGRIGTGKALFDVPERRKDNGASCGPIAATWHLPRAAALTLAKKTVRGAAGLTNGRIELKLFGQIPTTDGLDPLW